jgi:RNA polymerase sigma-70 factor (ECF subfamily)
LPNHLYRNLSDNDLLHKIALKQDTEAFAVLYNRYAHLALGVCLKYLQQEAAAQDAVQVVFVQLWQNIHQYQIRNFKPWLGQVLKNHCLMELRKKSPEQLIDASASMEFMEYEEEWHLKVKDEQVLQHLQKCLSELNQDQKKCIQLFYIDQHSYAQTAMATGFTDKEVKSYIQNGKRNLKICLKKNTKSLYA